MAKVLRGSYSFAPSYLSGLFIEHDQAVADASKLTPCASGAESLKLIVHALQRTYCFHASPPDSRPHPVLYSQPSTSVSCLKSGILKGTQSVTNLISTKRSPNLRTARSNIDVNDPTITPARTDPPPDIAHIARPE